MQTVPFSKQNDSSARTATVLMFALFISIACTAQYNVTEIITDYGGYWKTAATSINSIKPDNSHNLLSFSYKGNRFSTGVNDALLTAKGLAFVSCDFRALPVNSVSGAVTTNTKIGLGAFYDGNANGPSTPAPGNNVPYYLTDGIKGLDLGTGVANLPAGTVLFPVSKVLTASIGDAIPDIVITQIADPSGSLDRYEFADILGNRVGNYVDIQLDNILPVGNWTADFYDASKNPMTLAGGFTKTDRPIRLWASDLSNFGIDSSNASKVAYFRIKLSGNSDVAFVAYNNSTISIFNSLLPVTLDNFTGKAINSQVQLNWKTLSEVNSDAFSIERSTDGINFAELEKVKASSGSAVAVNYSYMDKHPVSGKNFYRLKMTDKDGGFDYSKIISVTFDALAVSTTINFYPNPASNYVVINHPFAGTHETLQIVGLNGTVVLQQKITAASFQTRINLPGLPKGHYELVWSDGKEVSSNALVVL